MSDGLIKDMADDELLRTMLQDAALGCLDAIYSENLFREAQRRLASGRAEKVHLSYRRGTNNVPVAIVEETGQEIARVTACRVGAAEDWPTRIEIEAWIGDPLNMRTGGHEGKA